MGRVAHFGIPYMGSKDKIAAALIERMPAGKRFVDLFGGGCAMSHAALTSHKWDTVFYNELNPLLVKLIKDTLAGKYSPKNFKPTWVSRERFEREKDRDAYIKYIWSFGNKGSSYLFGRDVEEIKRKGFELCVNGVEFDGFKAIGNTITARRLNLRKQVEARKTQGVLQLQEELERLERLEGLQGLERLEINCGSYLDYEHRDGDVVYCDPPYPDTARYNDDGFNHAEFFDWVASRKYPVWFSCYKVEDPRFKCVFAKRRRGTLSATNNNDYQWERLYTQAR